MKLAIQAANLSNRIRIGDLEMSLAKAILELSNIRIKLTHISGMLSNERKSDFLGWRHRSKDEVPQRWQKTPAELLQLQEEYERQRNVLDAAIQEANHRVTITV